MMNFKLFFAATLAAIVLVACAVPQAPAANSSTGDIVVTNAWSRPTIAMQPSGDTKAVTDTQMSGMTMNDMGPALYMMITNKGGKVERLIGFSSDVAGNLTIHETKDSGGMTMMEEVKGGLEIPAGGSVEFKPGGYHVMMTNMKRELKVGDSYTVTLKFQSRSDVPVIVTVREP